MVSPSLTISPSLYLSFFDLSTFARASEVIGWSKGNAGELVFETETVVSEKKVPAMHARLSSLARDARMQSSLALVVCLYSLGLGSGISHLSTHVGVLRDGMHAQISPRRSSILRAMKSVCDALTYKRDVEVLRVRVGVGGWQSYTSAVEALKLAFALR